MSSRKLVKSIEAVLIISIFLGVSTSLIYAKTKDAKNPQKSQGALYALKFTVIAQDLCKEKPEGKSELTVIEKFKGKPGEQKPTIFEMATNQKRDDRVTARGKLVSFIDIAMKKGCTYEHQNAFWKWENDLTNKNEEEISAMDINALTDSILKVYNQEFLQAMGSIFWMGGSMYFDDNGNIFNQQNIDNGTRFLELVKKDDKWIFKIFKIASDKNITLIKEWVK
jgi:hypothetical protein